MGSDVVRRKSFGAGLGCLCLAPPAKLRPGQVGVSQLGSDVEDVQEAADWGLGVLWAGWAWAQRRWRRLLLTGDKLSFVNDHISGAREDGSHIWGLGTPVQGDATNRG